MTEAFRTLISLKKEARDVLGIILRRNPLTKADFLDITKMTLSTLNRIMQPLEAAKLVVETSVGESTGGRKPVLYDVNSSRYHLIGVDISRTYTRFVVTNLKTDILYQEQFKMEETSTPEKVLEKISQSVYNACRTLFITRDEIIGMGIGAVGPLNRQKGILLDPAKFPAAGWRDVPLKDMAGSRTGLAVSIDNGANAAALAEYIHGTGKGFDNISYINCGMGIRTGTISSGRIVRTTGDAEDALGHMIVDMDGERCSCGNYGCIESYASISAMVGKFVSGVKKGRATTLEELQEAPDYTVICEAAENGDELSREVVINAGTALGVGLSNYIRLLAPQMIILSGPIIKHSNLFFNTCKGVALKKCHLNSELGIKFSRGGHFGENAIAAGAAASMLENILSSQTDGRLIK